MAGDEDAFSAYMIDLLTRHAGAGDADLAGDIPGDATGAKPSGNLPIALPRRSAPGELPAGVRGAGAQTIKGLGGAAEGAVTDFLRRHFVPRGMRERAIPGSTTGEASDIESIAEAFSMPEMVQTGIARGGSNIVRGILRQIEKNPKAAGAVASLLATTAGTQAAGTKKPEVPGVVPVDVPETFESTKQRLRDAIKKLQGELNEANKDRRDVHTRRGTHIITGGADPGVVQQKTERLTALQTELDRMEYEEKPFLEKYPNFPEQMDALSGALGLILGGRDIQLAQKTGKFGLPKKMALPGLAVGLPEAALSFGVPEGADMRGVGRAKKRVEEETWGEMLKRAAFETAEAGGSSGVGYKLGSAILPLPMKKVAVPGGPTADVVRQIEDLNRTFRPPPRLPAPAPATIPAGPPPNVRYDVRGRPYDPATRRTVPGVPWRRPQAPGAAAGDIPRTRVSPAEDMPDQPGATSIPGVLKLLGGPDKT